MAATKRTPHTMLLRVFGSIQKSKLKQTDTEGEGSNILGVTRNWFCLNVITKH